MIIDFHSHNWPDAIGPRAIASMARAVDGILWPVADGTLDNHIGHLEAGGVDMAVHLPIATKPTQFDVIMRRAEAIRSGEYGEKAQRMIHPFVSIHPADRAWEAHLDEVARRGFRGIKMHPYYQNFSLDDPRIWPMFRKIASLGLVVECHAGYDVGYPDRNDACGPKEIATLLRNVPGLTFVAAHLAGCAGYAPHATDELLDLGCYADTSALARDWYKDEQMRILRSWPSERLLFATDFPWVAYPEAIRNVQSIRERSDWDAIFSGNAKRLLGM